MCNNATGGAVFVTSNATGGAVFVTSKEDANIRCLLSL
jgi:hypothetical protein